MSRVFFSPSLALLIALPLALVACNKSAPGGPGGPGGTMPPPEVAVVTVSSSAHPIEFEYVGQTAGSRETEVRARVAGILLKRLYEEGSSVKAGMPLFQIDPASFQTHLAYAEAAVASAQARLNQTQRDHTRLVPLVAAKAISQKEFDDSKSALEAAQAALSQAQAQANEARLNLSYTQVVAPIAGVTGAANKSEGSLVTASDMLTTIVQTNPMYVNFGMSEADVLRLTEQMNAGQINLKSKRASNGSLGFEVSVKLADGSIFPLKGKLNFASEKVNPQTGNFDARAVIPNPSGNLRPGQFVRVLLSGATRPNTLAVPQRAIIDGPMGKMVFVVEPDNKLAPRPVQLDGWSQGNWIVTQGLKDGERVLVDGFIKAHDPGMTVKPVPYVPAANAAPNAKPPASQPVAPASAAPSANK